MSLLGNIFENPVIKKAAFGQLKSLIKSENLEFIIVKLDPVDGELEIEMYAPGEATILLTEKPAIADAENKDSL